MNTKMIRYILAKMLGVEALLLLPAFVAVIYGEKERRLVSGSDCSLSVLYLIGGRKGRRNR